MTKTKRRALCIALLVTVLAAALLTVCVWMLIRAREGDELLPAPMAIYAVTGTEEIRLSGEEQSAVYEALQALLPHAAEMHKECEGLSDPQQNRTLTLCLRLEYMMKHEYGDAFALLGEQPYDAVTVCVWSDALGLAAGVKGEPYDPARGVRLDFADGEGTAYATFKAALAAALSGYGERISGDGELIHRTVVCTDELFPKPNGAVSVFRRESYGCDYHLHEERLEDAYGLLRAWLDGQGGYLTETADSREGDYDPGPLWMAYGYFLELNYDTTQHFSGRVALRVSEDPSAPPVYREMTLEYNKIVLVLEEGGCFVYIPDQQNNGLCGPYAIDERYTALRDAMMAYHD